MITITFTLAWLKWAGLPLGLLSIVALLAGSLPDSGGFGWADGMRWVVWPAFLLWGVGFFIRGLWM